MNTQFEIKQEILSKFKCDRCGECCKIPIQVFSKDIIRLAEKLSMKNEMFQAQYIWEDPLLNNIYFLQDPCPFLTNKECSVYDARPDVCRIFPFAYDLPVLKGADRCNLAKDIYNVAHGIEQIVKSEFAPEQELTEGIYKKRFGDEIGKDSTLDITFSYDDLEYLANELRKRNPLGSTGARPHD